MKIVIENYTFDASLQTITFDDFTTISLDRMLIITNVTDGIIIYNFASATNKGTVATNVLTLAHDTTSMADTDILQIYYLNELTSLADDASGTITYLGYAIPGVATSAAAWQIQRLDTSTISLETEWADGNDKFDNIWDNRGSLSYS